MSRVRSAFVRRNEAGEVALVMYVTQGDPSPAVSADIVVNVAAAGADVVELGVPFSDPSADGPVIQAAMQRALAAGGGLVSALATVREVRDRGCDVPILLFGYYNPVFVFGIDRFADAAAAAGVDAVLIVDVPLEELPELREPLRRRFVDTVPLIAPTSGDQRIARLQHTDAPFVYYISVTGVTGARFASDGVAERVARVRELAKAPVAVGFGIATPADAVKVGQFADGVVVGSALVQVIASAGPAKAATAAGAFVGELRAALSQAAAK